MELRVTEPEVAPNALETINETEGVVWGLYYHLWRKTHKGQPCPGIHIPHTVLYQDSAPIAWYFTSVKDNQVYRKKKSNVNGPAIWAAFHAGQEPDGDACAWFSGNMTRLTTVSKKKCKSPRQHTEEQLHLHPPPKEKEQASFEFLTSDRVEQLTAPSQYSATVEQIYDGLLQKFVPPREAHDAMVRAVWSPSACVCERRTSRHPLLDTRIPLCDRAASFHDNNFWLTTHQALPPGTVLVQRLIKQCDSVVSHLKEVSGGALVVARMELYFKVDTSSRVWLLCCNSLRLDRSAATLQRWSLLQRQPSSSPSSLKDPCQREEDTHIAEDPTPFLCVATGTQCHGSQRVDITYRVLMQAWFAEAAQLAHPSDRMQALDNVPPALRRANPNLTRDYYLRMRAQPAFLLKTAPVCQEAAQALAPTSLQDLMRTVCGPTSPLAASATTPAYPTPPHHTPQPSSLPSRTSLAHHGAPGTPCSSNLPTASTQPEVLYAPGASIPAALQPKAWALASGGARLPLMLLPAGHTGSGTASPSWASQRPLPPQQAAAEAGGGEAGNRHEGGATRKAQSARPRHTLPTPASPPPRPSSSRVSTHLLPLTSQQPQPSTSPAQAHAHAPGTGRLAGNSPAAPGPGSSSPLLRDAPTPSSRTGGAASSLSPSSLAPAVLPSKQLWTLSATSSAEPLPARQPGLTSSDLQALRQLTDACAQAEVVTQSLLAQAGQLLLEHDAEPPVPQPLKPAETLRGPGLGSNTAVARSAAPPAPHTSHLSGLAGRPARGGTAQLSATLPGEGRPPLVGAAQRTGSGSEGVVGAIRGAGRARSASQPPPDIRLPDINKPQCVSTQSVRQDIFGQRADAGSRGQVLAGGMLQLKKDGLVATGPVPNLHASLWSANEAALLSEALNESALE